MRRALLSSSAFAGAGLVFAALVTPAAAQDATWLASPASGDFNIAGNWSPAAVPTGTAAFDTSNTTSLSFSANTTIGGWTFNTGASNYTFFNGQTLDFTGAGIVINGGSAAIDNGAFSILNFSNASTAGSATITNGSVQNFNDSSSAAFASIINNNSLLFRDTSTAGNATITNNGILDFFANSTASSAMIANNAEVDFRNTTTAANARITNNIGDTVNFTVASTAGSATINNTGRVFFLNVSTAGSATINNWPGGNVNFFNGSNAGTAVISNNWVLEFHGTSTAFLANIATGFVTDFNDNSTAGSAIINNIGALNFDNISTAGSATITNNALVFFGDNSTGGGAAITNNAGGTVDFSGSLGPAGDHKLSAGSIAGAGDFYLGGNTLTVGNSQSTTVSGVISDCGSGGHACFDAGATGGALTKIGSGTLTLSGNNTYTGATTVDAGTLIVNGSIAPSSGLTVNSGAIAGGTGTLPSTVINAGGTLSPGHSIGTINVSGNLSFNAGSIYLVEVSPSAADRTNVSGTAALAGTVDAVFQPGSYMTRNYTILNAGTLAGTFDTLTTANLPAGFQATLDYTGNDVLLLLTGQLGIITGLTVNEQNVANALNNFFNGGGTLPPNFAMLFELTGSALSAALDQASGEAATGAQQGAFQLGGEFLSLMLDPFVDGRGNLNGNDGGAFGFAPEQAALPDDVALAYARALDEPIAKAPITKAPAFARRWGVWGAAYGGYNHTDGSHDLSAHAGGFALGADYHVTADTAVGFALAGGGTNWSLANGIGSGRSDAFQAGAYGITRVGAAYIGASFAFSNYWMSTDRFAAFGDHLTADFNAQGIGGRLEGGYRFDVPAVGIVPYAAMQVQGFRTPAYREADLSGGGFALAYDSRTATDTRSELGARFDHVAAIAPTGVLLLRGRLAWAHDWVSDPVLTAAFQTLPGASFIVNGAAPAQDSALVTAGAELRLASGATLAAKFDGEFAGHSQTYAGTATLRTTW